jgi:hypothetical protein
VNPSRGDGQRLRGWHHRGVTTYRIVVEGELSDRFVATFDEMRLERRPGETWLTGRIADQAQLQGLITRIADLGISLRSFGPVASDSETDPAHTASGAEARDIVTGGRA